MTVKVTEQELTAYARELFRVANTSFADMEENVVDGWVKKVVEKHTALFSIGGHSLIGGNGFPVKVPATVFQGERAERLRPQPQQTRQLELFDSQLAEQANEAESRF